MTTRDDVAEAQKIMWTGTHGERNLSLREERNRVGIYGHGGGRRCNVSEMDREFSTFNETKRVQDVDLFLPGERRLDTSETEVVATSHSHLCREPR